MKYNSLSRRDFLKLSGMGLGALVLNPFKDRFKSVLSLAQFAPDVNGRIAVTPNFYTTELKSQPNSNVPAIRLIGQDETIVWHREVVGTDAFGGTSKRWYETSEGFLYAPHVQPVKVLPNTPITAVPAGKQGFWAEVTVPYVDLQLQNEPISPAMKFDVQNSQPIRLYYSQVVWIDQIGAGPSGNILYRLSEPAGHGNGPGDAFLADAVAFRPLTLDDVAPISPNVDPATKRIEVDATPQHQYLSCFEGSNEVYFCRISSGYGDKYSTPTGGQSVDRKVFSVHMAANTGSDSGYDTMAVPWPTFFNSTVGAAIHGVFWHNDFGVRRSHGCVNVLPEDAKWIFRWTTPSVSLDQSDLQLQWPNVGGSFSTSVKVSELTVPV